MNDASASAEERFREPRAIVRLWIGVLLAPAAWAAQMAAGYAVLPWLCANDTARFVPIAIGGVGLVLALAGVLVAFANWRAAGRGWRATGRAAVDRARFMAVTGLLLGTYVSAIIVLQLALSVGLDPCA